MVSVPAISALPFISSDVPVKVVPVMVPPPVMFWLPIAIAPLIVPPASGNLVANAVVSVEA
jgi:hypothetical protein